MVNTQNILKNDLPKRRFVKAAKWIAGLTWMTVLLFAQLQLLAQYSETDYERFKIKTVEKKLSGISLSPDGKTLALSQTGSKPAIIWDRENQQVFNEFNAGLWWSGSRVSYSPTGNYILLQQLMFVDFNKNKNRALPFEVIDATIGQKFLAIDKCQDVIVTRDEKSAIALVGNEVVFYSLPSGKKEKLFVVEGLTNALAESPDGKMIALSRKVTIDDLSPEAQSKKNKKARKFTLAYKQVITVYDAQNFQPVFTVNELYDNIYRLKFSPDGQTLFCLQIPPTKARTVSDPMVYVNTVDMNSREPISKAYTAKAVYEPDFEISHNGKLAALATKGSKFQEINLYDQHSGQILKRFELSSRLFEKDDEGVKISDNAYPSMVFLPGDESLLISLNNHLVLWNLNLNE